MCGERCNVDRREQAGMIAEAVLLQRSDVDAESLECESAGLLPGGLFPEPFALECLASELSIPSCGDYERDSRKDRLNARVGELETH